MWKLALLAAMTIAIVPVFAQDRPIVRLSGADFVGGAAKVFGDAKFDATRVNYIYAQPTGETAAMTATFALRSIPSQPMYLHLRGRLDDRNSDCPIEISVNGKVLFSGSDAYPHDRWELKAWPIPLGTLHTGDNEITIRNIAKEGVLGMPPWFMMSSGAIGSETCNLGPALEDDFFVTLPDKIEQIPHEGSKPGFKLRGTKGWCWLPEQYMAEIPHFAEFKLNFLMNCYGSMCDIEHYPFGNPKSNRWWEPIPDEKKRKYEEVIRACQANNIEFCFSMNPTLAAERIARYDSSEDLDIMWQHFSWAQSNGVKWFNIMFDDISEGIDAAGQSRFVNALYKRLKDKDPAAKMIFGPTIYWGTGEDPNERKYLEVVARELDPDILIFWTGPQVCCPKITRSDAEKYKSVIKHKLLIWDNYPVNDGNSTLHLGPITGRDPELVEVVEGYMSNPMFAQNEINRVPLLTMADYMLDPWDYDPGRSIGQSILHFAQTPEQRQALKDLVELYPGFVLYGNGNTGWNPAKLKLNEIMDKPHSRYLADLYIKHVEDVSARMKANFPGVFQDAVKTVDGNLEAMKSAYREHYGAEPR